MNDKQMLDDMVKRLDQAETNIDAQTLARLRQVRANAINQAEDMSTNTRGWMNWALPAMSVSATAVIAVLAINLRLMSLEQPELLAEVSNLETMMSELEIISTEQDLEFYHDLEFYQWLTYKVELEDSGLEDSELKDKDLG